MSVSFRAFEVLARTLSSASATIVEGVPDTISDTMGFFLAKGGETRVARQDRLVVDKGKVGATNKED